MFGIKAFGAALLGLTAVAVAQSPSQPAVKVSLEDLLTKALQNSPELQVAEAKLREADALYRQARMQVVQRLMETQANFEREQRQLVSVEVELKRLDEQRKAGAVSAGEVQAVEQRLIASRSALSLREAALNAMTGRGPVVGAILKLEPVLQSAAGGGAGGDPPPSYRLPPQAMRERMIRTLNRPLKKMDKGFEGVPIAELMDFVRSQSPDVPFLVNLGDRREEPIKLDFRGETSIGGFLQVICDTVPDLKVFLRDYGFLVTFAGNEPSDALPLPEFWTGEARQP